MFNKHQISLAVMGLVAMSGTAAAQTAPGAVTELERIIVTSQKRSEDVKTVPLSVTAISAEGLKDNQISNFTDISRNVPNVSFSSQGGAGLSTIEIRGVSSQAGSATVGVYMDDVSLTTRNLYSQGTAEPHFFDLERVEVLRGPQGTLYGAGSMGGTLRFISKTPNLKRFSADFNAEVSSTSHGGVNSMAQAVFNVPLSTDVAALRIGVQVGRDSGYVDQVDPASLKVTNKDINSANWSVLKLALKVNAGADWSLTPALFYQKTKSADIDATYLNVGSYQPFNAGVALPLFQTSKPVREPGIDTLILPSITINGDLGFADLTAVANAYQRKFVRTQDGTNVNSSYIGSLINDPGVSGVVSFLPSAVYLDNKIDQKALEIRLASKGVEVSKQAFTWVAGVYFAQAKTDVSDNEPVFGINAAFKKAGLNIYDPAQWSDGAGIFNNAFPGDNSYFSARHYDSKQSSIFGEATYHVSERLRLIAGLRYLRSTEDFKREGDFFFAGGPTTTAISSKANKATPRLALDWDVSKETTVYANVADGFRLGGANRPIPLTIQGNVDDLKALGLKAAPDSFAPDSLRSFEVGSKSRLWNNRLSLNVSVYHINWNNIQQDVYLPSAGFDFETNVGRATSTGIEAELKARVTNDFLLNVSGGYNKAQFAEDVPFLGLDGSGLPNVRKGDPIQGVPKTNFRLGGEYQFRGLGGVDSVLRLNAQWTGSSHGALKRSDPDYLRPSYMTVDGSWGMTLGRWDLNLMVKNLTNDHTVLQRPNIQSVNQAFYLRPRTIGLTVSSSI